MAVIYTEHFVQFFDDNGDPLSGGKLYAYSAGTTTAKATYTTAAASVEHAHPIVLDSAGRATIFIEGSYRFDLYDANDVLIDSTDNITSFTTFGDTGDPFFQTFSGTGSQTVFTLSESLGTDSKNLMVFVDAGGTEGYEIQNTSAYTLSGTSLTFNSAPASGTDNIYVFAPSKLLGEAAASAAAAASSEAAAAASETAAAASAVLAATYDARYKGTSTTSLAIGTGSKAFTTQASKFFDVGVWVLVTSDADETNYMHGQVTAYSGTSLTVNVTNVGGSGTLADWTITVSGTRGADGAPVSAGSITATELASNAVETAKINDNAVTLAKLEDGTQGDILYYGASGAPARLGAGTSGQFLKTQGAGANPVWADNTPGYIQTASATYATYGSTTAVVPQDDTIPQNTEGTELLTASITPTNSANKLVIVAQVPHWLSAGINFGIMSLFQDSTANALATVHTSEYNAGMGSVMTLTYVMTAGTTSATTFKIRVGTTGGTFYYNGNASSRLYGGVLACRLTIMEVAA